LPNGGCKSLYSDVIFRDLLTMKSSWLTFKSTFDAFVSKEKFSKNMIFFIGRTWNSSARMVVCKTEGTFFNRFKL